MARAPPPNPSSLSPAEPRTRLNPSQTLTQRRLLVVSSASFSIAREKQIFQTPAARDRLQSFGRRSSVQRKKHPEFPVTLASASKPTHSKLQTQVLTTKSTIWFSTSPARRFHRALCRPRPIQTRKTGHPSRW